jgi:hypothetical protein
MEEKSVYPSHFYEMKEGEQTMDRTPASEAVKGKTRSIYFNISRSI